MASSLIHALQAAVVRRTCTIERFDYTWCFVFGGGAREGCTVTTMSWWRIVGHGRVAHASDDDGQQFGLPAPVDGVEQGNRLLDGAVALSASVDAITSDLTVCFEGDLRLDILTSSSGYESWQANFRLADDHLTLICCGGGEMSFTSIPAGTRPKVVTARALPRNDLN